MLRLYIDEDSMSDALLRALRAEDVDVTSAADAGKRGLGDEQQLAFATDEGRVLYTANVRDFGRIHAAWLAEDRRHAGIVVVPRQRIPVGEQARLLLRLVRALSAEDMADRIEFLTTWAR